MEIGRSLKASVITFRLLQGERNLAVTNPLLALLLAFLLFLFLLVLIIALIFRHVLLLHIRFLFLPMS
jgi:hypothetical protein